MSKQKAKDSIAVKTTTATRITQVDSTSKKQFDSTTKKQVKAKEVTKQADCSWLLMEVHCFHLSQPLD